MNMVSLWLMAYLEAGLHSVPYLKYTLLLVVGTQLCQVAAGAPHTTALQDLSVSSTTHLCVCVLCWRLVADPLQAVVVVADEWSRL